MDVSLYVEGLVDYTRMPGMRAFSGVGVGNNAYTVSKSSSIVHKCTHIVYHMYLNMYI